jgi:hypothetical protein
MHVHTFNLGMHIHVIFNIYQSAVVLWIMLGAHFLRSSASIYRC